jgi:hypothetical protein
MEKNKSLMLNKKQELKKFFKEINMDESDLLSQIKNERSI